MRRRLITFLSALSLLLCAAAGVLWVRTRLVTEQVGRWSRVHTDRWVVEESRGVFSSRGGLVVAEAVDRQTLEGFRVRDLAPPEPFERSGWIRNAPAWPIEDGDGDTPAAGFDWVHSHGGTADVTMHSTHRQFLRVPYWFLVLVTAALPGWKLLTFLRRASAGAGS